ncbi:Hypothetical predicted protein [Paramuricea clavata]|uniref:Uncharacterized protein n=1 Tax=Paramuricea clavata TaxID=317549 RepID=A0A6S7INS8_PARCT|nr:Hypothetical predicted protein [Paramuricea clavata]
MKLNIELLQSRTDALQSLANAQQVCSPITDCLRNIEILRQELSEEREITQKIEFVFKVFKGENLNVDAFGGQNCKSEPKVTNKEIPKRDETIPEFQCTEDSPEEISLIINNKPNYEADEYSVNAKYDKSSITPEFSVTAPVSESTCIALHKPTKQTREPITQSKRPVWLSKLPLINCPESILNHTDNNLTRSRKSEYKVANKESPKRDETIPEFQCTEDSPEEISLIINNKPNYEADEYSLNANYDKSSITPEIKCVEASLENSCLIVDTTLNSESKPKTVRKQSFAVVPTLPKSIKGRSKSKPNFF